MPRRCRPAAVLAAALGLAAAVAAPAAAKDVELYEGESSVQSATTGQPVRSSLSASSSNESVATVSQPKGDRAEVTITAKKEGEATITVRGRQTVYKVGLNGRKIGTEEPFETYIVVTVKKREEFAKLAVVKVGQQMTIRLPKELHIKGGTFKNHNKDKVYANQNTSQQITIKGLKENESRITFDLYVKKKKEKRRRVKGVLHVKVVDEKPGRKEKKIRIGWNDLYIGRIILVGEDGKEIKPLPPKKDRKVSYVVPSTFDGFLISAAGWQVASDSPKHCTHGDGNAGTPRTTDSGGTDGGGLPVVVADDEEDEEASDAGEPSTVEEPPDDETTVVTTAPRSTPDPRPVVVHCKAVDEASGDPVAKRQVKLVDPSLANPAFAYTDANKDDAGFDGEPRQCVTGADGTCDVGDVTVNAYHIPPAAFPGEVQVTVPGSERQGFNAAVKNEDVPVARRRFGPAIENSLVLGGLTYLTFNASPRDAYALKKSARAQGLKLKPDSCRKEEPGPWIDYLDELRVPPSAVLPSARVHLEDLEGGESR